MPKWLSSKYTPINDRLFKEKSDYPDWKKVPHPIEWLRQLYWCTIKITKCTLLIDITKSNPDFGEGYIDCFEYLKLYLKNHYKELCPPDYLNNYICFHKD